MLEHSGGSATIGGETEDLAMPKGTDILGGEAWVLFAHSLLSKTTSSTRSIPMRITLDAFLVSGLNQQSNSHNENTMYVCQRELHHQ